MRIAIYHNLPSGGAKRMLFELSRRLSRFHELTAYSLSNAEHSFGDLRTFTKDYQVHSFSTTPLLKSPFGRLNQLMRLRDLGKIQKIEEKIGAEIDQQNFDLVWVQPCQIQNSPSILQHIHKTPKIFMCQEPLRIMYESMPERPYDNKKSTRRMVLDKLDPLPGIFFSSLKSNDQRNIQAADMVLVNSRHMQQAVKDTYPVNPFVNYPGVDANFFKPLDLKKGNYVFSVGSLTPLKGFDFLINAIALLPEEFRPPLKIASNFSNPPERDYLTDLARKKEVSLILEGNISDQRLAELYNQALITIYAPIREPFGLVAIESMACGTPVIGVNEGGLRETIKHGKTGFLIERDEFLFSQALKTLLVNKELRQEMGENGRQEVIDHWTWQKSTETLENHFRTTISK